MADENQKQQGPRPVRLLIADDNASARASMKALLQSISGLGLEIYEAANGQEALALSGQVQPEVVLMDAQMPLMDGIEATRIIKQRWPAVRVIVLTMHSTYQTEALAAGADQFLLKGTPTDVLLAAIFQPRGEENQKT